MSSSPQVLPFVGVWDYLYEAYSAVNQAPPPVAPGTEVKVTLQTTTGVVDAPAVLLDPGPFSAKTDQNGFWELWLVPNTHINAGNSWYSVQTSTRVYDIFVGNAGGQSQSLIINAPTALPPGTTILNGPLTVPGLLTAQGGLSATGPISFPASSIPIADITPPVAVDSTVLHKAGAEAVTGVKDFTAANPVFAAAAIPESAIAGLLADLAARVLSAAPVFSPGTVAAAALAASIPRGALGFVSVGADGATVGAAELTVLTLGAITVPAGRRVRLTSFIWDFTGTNVTDVFEIRFKQAGMVPPLQGTRLRVQTGLPVGGIQQAILTPGAGTFTWSLTLIRTAGAGVLNFGAAVYPAWLMAEDIGV